MHDLVSRQEEASQIKLLIFFISSGNAPMGSIKDRIKSFEVMKESGTTSPRARSPITEFTANNHKTIRRTINWERDGTERRQIRRSERKEAQLRREHEVTQDNNEIDTSDEKNVRSTRKVNERRPPRIAPKVKEKPSESSLRRKSQEYKGNNFHCFLSLVCMIVLDCNLRSWRYSLFSFFPFRLFLLTPKRGLMITRLYSIKCYELLYQNTYLS